MASIMMSDMFGIEVEIGGVCVFSDVRLRSYRTPCFTLRFPGVETPGFVPSGFQPFFYALSPGMDDRCQDLESISINSWADSTLRL